MWEADLGLEDGSARKPVLSCRILKPHSSASDPLQQLRTQAECLLGVVNLSVSISRLRSVACPMQCGSSFSQTCLPLHAAFACPLALLPCRNARLGCKEVVRRCDQKQHEEAACAFQPVSTELEQVQSEVRSLKLQAAQLAAAFRRLPTMLEEEEEARAQRLVEGMPPGVLSEAREACEGREWTRLSWSARLEICQAMQRDVRAIEEPREPVGVQLEQSWTGEKDPADQPVEQQLVCTAILRHAGGESAFVKVVEERG